ncbi:MAG TPA: phosphate ABC transporter permease subunit PstC, partial [Bacteroidales bacterium]|nr:phosphate ABC transporter permease subunit PstC [Bacteroidales bacterium]
MKKLKRFVERIVEGMLTVSGMVTSVTILLIIIFLFKEGSGLFKSPVVEEGYQLFVNAKNPVNSLNSYEIKQIFDVEVDNWKSLGGADQEIKVFRFEEIFDLVPEEEMGENYALLPQKLGEVVKANPNIVAYLPTQYAPKNLEGVKMVEARKISLLDFFGGKEWMPTSKPSAQLGVLPLILGTLLVSLVAILIALPLGLGVAIYLSELAGEKARNYL